MGYGVTQYRGGKRNVPRLVYELLNGELADGLVIRHKCPRNRRCIRQSHLETGTTSDNMMDKVRDGTHNRGERHGRVKLKEADVLEIRRRLAAGGVTKVALAEEYGVDPTTVYNIERKIRWAWLQDEPANESQQEVST